MASKAEVLPHKIIVVLGLPRPVSAFIIRAGQIHDSFVANTASYPSPPVAMTVFAAHIADLTAKEQAAKARTTGAVADRDASRKQVVVDLGELQGYVSQVVNATPANAAVLAQDAGMSVRKYTHPAKPPLAAKQKLSGTVQLVAKATKGAKSNEWQYSTDGGKTWVDLPPTTKASTTVNLMPGTTVSYRQRVLTKSGRSDWSQPISALVT